ncbi:hypothetical protein C8R43DRAFT_944918 [Mycena crocata]|nr:hypothetical protein C8R43DRAFT_944918 [Mycena crocata]
MSESPNDCEDCGKVFPLREATGLCPKCVKLRPHALDSTEYKEIFVYILNYFSCMHVLTNLLSFGPSAAAVLLHGETWPFLQQVRSKPVVLLLAKFLQLLQLKRQTLPVQTLWQHPKLLTQDAQEIRTAAVRDRLRLPPAHSKTLGTNLTTVALLQHEHDGDKHGIGPGRSYKLPREFMKVPDVWAKGWMTQEESGSVWTGLYYIGHAQNPQSRMDTSEFGLLTL